MSVNSTQINSKQIQKAIKKGAKKAITASGTISSTRSGDKELSHLVGKLSQQSFSSLEAAQSFGETLGQRIIELSQKLNRTHFDQGVIRQLSLSKDIPSVAKLPQQTTQPVTDAGETRHSNQALKSAQLPQVAEQPPVGETQTQEDITSADTSELPQIESTEEVHQDDEVEAVESPSEVVSEQQV